MIHGLIRNVLSTFKEFRSFPLFFRLLISLTPLCLEDAFCEISTFHVVEDCSVAQYMVYLGVLGRHLKRCTPYFLLMCKSNSGYQKYKH